MNDLIEKLCAPFPIEAHKWRVGATSRDKTKGVALCYIDARDVQDRLDEAVGPENWQSEFVETPSGRILCRLSIRIGDEWVSKMDGAGDTSIEGEKGGISDALKRAAVQWGVGRYLYTLEAPWVDLENKRITKREEAKLKSILMKALNIKGPSKADMRPVYERLQNALRACQNTDALKEWAANNKGDIANLPADWQEALRAEWKKEKAALEATEAGREPPEGEYTAADYMRAG